jgi:signal transduction histidine kinase
MKKNALEPGLLQIIKFLTVIEVLYILVVRRVTGAAMGVEVPLDRWLVLSLTIPIFMVAFTWIPWWQDRLGRAFLPIAILIFAIGSILAKYLTLAWLVPPQQQELETLLLVVNLWVLMQVIVLLVAWQYSWEWVLFTAILLSIADGVLTLPFLASGTPLYWLSVLLLFARAAGITMVGFLVYWLVNRQRQQRTALAEANRRLGQYAAATEQLAISQERNRLARELHDTLAHSLSSIKVQLTAADALWQTEPHRAHQMLLNAMDTTLEGLNEARRALTALRASPLEDLGLGLAVRDLAESTAARANLKLDLEVQSHLEDISPDVEQAVYRVAQEALTNVARHARAHRVRVALERANGHLTLIIADDGRGFDPTAVNGAHYGLKGMRERVELMGGTLDVTSADRQGTTVKLQIGD